MLFWCILIDKSWCDFIWEIKFEIRRNSMLSIGKINWELDPAYTGMPFLGDLIYHWSRSRNNCTCNSSYLLGVNARANICIFLGYRGKTYNHDRLVSMDPQQIPQVSFLADRPLFLQYFYIEIYVQRKLLLNLSTFSIFISLELINKALINYSVFHISLVIVIPRIHFWPIRQTETQ